MNEKKKETVQKYTQRNMDNPEQYPTENESIFDMFESEQTVDPIPMEDLKEELREEKAKHDTKDTSSSEKKFNPEM
ncbi:MAG TPA: hypothetical protein VNR61_02580 [Niallia sp.]|nr:hypothetical protein [Niallia sp.]